MRKLCKKILSAAGLSLQRIPAGLPSGHDLRRDLRLVTGPAPVCVDVGAHDGQFVDWLRGTFAAPVIHAFEPAPAPFQRLRARHAASNGTYLTNAGLSDEAGEMTFNIFDNQALNSFLPLTAGGADFGRPRLVEQKRVSVLRLDDYAAQHGLGKIDLLKIDTQGYELRVLRGAERLLAGRNVGAVLAEVSFTPLYEGQVWAHEIIAHLHGHGLQLVEFYEKCRLGPMLGWCTALFARRDSP